MNIKTLLLAASLATALISAPACRPATEVIDQVVAIVDDDIIMASELRERVTAVSRKPQGQGLQMPPEDALIRETLDRLILESIQLQKGTRVGVRISDAQLNSAMQRIAAQNRMTWTSSARRWSSRASPTRHAGAGAQGNDHPARAGGQRQPAYPDYGAGSRQFHGHQEGQILTQPEYHILHALLAISPEATDARDRRGAKLGGQGFKRIRAGNPSNRPLEQYQPVHLQRRRPGLAQAGRPALAVQRRRADSEAGQTADPIRSDSGLHLIYMRRSRGGEQIVARPKPAIF